MRDLISGEKKNIYIYIYIYILGLAMVGVPHVLNSIFCHLNIDTLQPWHTMAHSSQKSSFDEARHTCAA